MHHPNGRSSARLPSCVKNSGLFALSYTGKCAEFSAQSSNNVSCVRECIRGYDTCFYEHVSGSFLLNSAHHSIGCEFEDFDQQFGNFVTRLVKLWLLSLKLVVKFTSRKFFTMPREDLAHGSG